MSTKKSDKVSKVSKRPYKKVWTGGTFDHFHEGHKELIDKAFEVGDFVVIAILADEVVQDKQYAALIQTLEVRKSTIDEYLAKKYGRDRYKIVVQDAVYTDASLDPELEANILCYKTEQHFYDINKRREDKGLKPLVWVMSPNKYVGISSTEIRKKLSENSK